MMVYQKYVMENVPYRKNLENIIQENLSDWLNSAKEQDRERAEKEVREKRNELLSKSDKEMCIDRLGLEKPSGNTFKEWLPFLTKIADKMSSPEAEYRQQLRDITKQDGFPYDVVYPKLEE